MIDAARAQVIIEALDSGASVEDAVGIAKITMRAVEDAWREGVTDADHGQDTPAADFYLESKAAAARARMRLRASAVDAAEAGRHSAANFIRLLEQQTREVEPADDPRPTMVPLHDPETRRLADELLWRISAPGPGPTRAERAAAGEPIEAMP